MKRDLDQRVDFCSPNVSVENHWTCFELYELKEIALAFNIYIQRNKICNEQLDICSPKKLIKINNKTKKQLWKSIYNSLELVCKYEHCWVDLDFVKKIDDKYLQDKIKYFTFKPKMNERSDKWLGTKDINNVLQQYQEFDHSFKFLGALPSDFYKVTKVKWKEIYNYKKIGIVFNLDGHRELGSHWVAFLIDNTNKTLEYYDSTGNLPNANIQKFINKIIDFLKKDSKLQYITKINKIRHQYKNSECGIYSIHFIIQRLLGYTFEEITTTIIKDDDMKKFRSRIFL